MLLYRTAHEVVRAVRAAHSTRRSERSEWSATYSYTARGTLLHRTYTVPLCPLTHTSTPVVADPSNESSPSRAEGSEFGGFVGLGFGGLGSLGIISAEAAPARRAVAEKYSCMVGGDV
jgi:hypothetical protein